MAQQYRAMHVLGFVLHICGECRANEPTPLRAALGGLYSWNDWLELYPKQSGKWLPLRQLPCEQTAAAPVLARVRPTCVI